MPKADIAALLALCAALAAAVGNVLRQRSAQEVTDKPVGHLKLFRMSLGDTRWWLGAAAAIANYGLLVAALGLGSVVLATSLQVTALLFASPIYTRVTHHRVTRWEWTWAVLLAVALAVFIMVGDPRAGHSRGSLATWIVVAAVMAPTLVLCVLAARIWPARQAAAVLLAVVAGSSLAVFFRTDQGRPRGARRRFRGAAAHARGLRLDLARADRDDLSAVVIPRRRPDRLDADGDRG